MIRPARLALLVAVLVVAVHVAAMAMTPYELHRDELLYAAMGTHLDLWRMDFPPLIAMLANAQRAVCGDVAWGLRVLPAMAHAVLAWLAVDTARRLGGTPSAQWLAGLCVAANAAFLRAGTLFQPVVFDQLWWSLGLWALLRCALDDDRRWWLLVGVAFGLGLLTKFSIAFIGVGVLVGTVLSARRHDLATPWPWVAAAMALTIGAPSVAGQIALGWPVVGQMRDLASAQLAHVTPMGFIGEQFLQGPATVVALVGAMRLLRDRAKSGLRAVGLACVVAFGLLMLLHGKPYYAYPIYPVLFGAGASQLSQWGETLAARSSRWAIRGVSGLQLAYGVLILPMGLPVLPPPLMARYAAWLGGGTTTNTGGTLPLPQDYADMLGWRETVDSAAAVFRRLPEADRTTATVVGLNYGRAGALDWYGPPRGLPRPVSPLGSFWFWGHGPQNGAVALVVGGNEAFLRTYWADVQLASMVRNPWRVEEEREVRVYLVRGGNAPLQALWRDFKGRN